MSVELKVNGKYFAGWQSVRIERGIEQMAGSFELAVTDRWNTAQGQVAKDIKPGQSCEVLLKGQVVITGYVDAVSSNYEKQNHIITISGRDKTGDLVDCSSIFKTGHWSGKRLEQIAADLLKPFGIAVKKDTDTGAAIPAFSIQEGESVFETLERATKMKALLMISDGSGSLVITRAGTGRAPADLIEGGNILQASAEFSWKDRFSQYLVKGQAQGNDLNHAHAVAHPAARINDTSITRYRPLLVIAEDQGGNTAFQQRAEWERNVRKGRGNRATITVQGWDANGQLWQPNTLAHVQSPLVSADLDLLIVSVSYSLDDSGTLTTLKLAEASAFDTIAQAKQTRLDKKIRKAQGEESPIIKEKWEW